ncbi:MAG: methyltransferase domain-containing protein [Nanoarchaeota archaeon]
MNNIFLKRYDEFFGLKSSQKLIEIQKSHMNDKYIRINFSKTSKEKIETFFKKNRVKFSNTFLPNCLKIEKSFFNLVSSLPALTGQIYFQDIASQIPANLIEFSKFKSKKISVLDMAASPGSKTTQIADKLREKKLDFEIFALEPEVKRLQKLINNIQKQSFENIKIFNTTGQEFKTKKKFDLIILDAPCSGNLITDRNWLSKRNLMGVEQKSKLQRELLKKASSLLCENGILIYSTCSQEPEENEFNVNWALSKLPLVKGKTNFVLPFENPLIKSFKGQNFELGTSFRICPIYSKTQGFFVSIFEKK